MSTIAQIKTATNTNIRAKTAANSISQSNVADQIDLVADELSKSQKESTVIVEAASVSAFAEVFEIPIAANLFTRNGDKIESRLFFSGNDLMLNGNFRLLQNDASGSPLFQSVGNPSSDVVAVQLYIVLLRKSATQLFVWWSWQANEGSGFTVKNEQEIAYATFDPTILNTFQVQLQKTAGGYQFDAGFSTLTRAMS